VLAGLSELRPEINGVLFTIEPSIIKLTATDSFRLAEASINEAQFKNHLSTGLKVVIPLKTAETISKIIKDGETDSFISIYFENNQILAKTDSTEIISRLIDGKFPDYEAIIPKSLYSEVIIERDELVKALKLANSFALRVKDVKIKSRDKKVLEIYSSDNSIGENKYMIPGKINGDDFESTFNLKYFLDGAKTENSDRIYLGINEENKPALIKTPNSTNYFYILMPVKA